MSKFNIGLPAPKLHFHKTNAVLNKQISSIASVVDQANMSPQNPGTLRINLWRETCVFYYKRQSKLIYICACPILDTLNLHVNAFGYKVSSSVYPPASRLL